jgi:hypothetical protein
MMCIIFLLIKEQNFVLAHLDLLWDAELAAVFTNGTFFPVFGFPSRYTTRRFTKLTIHFARDSFTGYFLGVRTTRTWSVCHKAGFFILQQSANRTEKFYCIFYATAACLCVQSSCPHKIISTRNFKININKMSRPALGLIQPPIQWVLWARSPGIKRQGSKADHSPLSSAEVKKEGVISSLSHKKSWRAA